MRFLSLATTLDAVSKTTKRKEKISLVARLLKEAELSEVCEAALFLAGRFFPENDQRTLNVSWSGLIGALHNVIDFRDDEFSKFYEGDTGEAIAALMESKAHTRQSVLFQEPLTVESVSDRFTKIALAAGKGSMKEKQSLISALLGEAAPREMRYIVALILNDMRTGLSHGLLVECIAEAFSVDIEYVRRAWYFTGDLGGVAHLAAEYGNRGLKQVNIKPMTAVKPMLASPVSDLKSALEIGQGGELSFEMKFDGARVQIHKEGGNTRIFSRGLNDVTESLPDIVQEVNKRVRASRFILDGEVVAVDPTGKPYPFQVVMQRFGRTRDVETTNQEVKLLLYAFDILLLNGQMLIDEPYWKRREQLESTLPDSMIAERVVTNRLRVAEDFFLRSKEIGHEGLVAKMVSSPYVPGVRGKHWLKIKHTLDTMDLVIIAAEWGHGRRSKWLSDYHLAVLDEETDKYTMVGKTFKGLTDVEFQAMTDRLQRIELSRSRGLVRVKPEIIVEVLAAEIQESPKYESGLALRFARITGIRDDKKPEDATTLKELQATFDVQFRYKAR
ncbi:MAG: DNA ligase [Candidatus Thorarchaeota archaeon]|nr:MAG: DNA ligase [Candidatus Thorarchaeota archaeon]